MTDHDNLAPWDHDDAIRWLGTVESWTSFARLIEKTLRQEPRKFPHQIRAATALVIMFCRPNMWPSRQGAGSIESILSLARRQLVQVKQLFSHKARINPDLKRDRTFRTLMDSLDQELRILESRVGEDDFSIPEHPPCTWTEFWHEERSAK